MTKVLRQQKLYGATKILRMFPNKNWTLSGVKTVGLLSKIDATGKGERCSGSGRPRMARSPDTIRTRPPNSRIWTPSTTRCGDPTRVCVQASITGSSTWKSCASVSRRNGTVWTSKWLTTRSVNGASDWQPALQPVEDILNIHSEHCCICLHTD